MRNWKLAAALLTFATPLFAASGDLPGLSKQREKELLTPGLVGDIQKVPLNRSFEIEQVVHSCADKTQIGYITVTPVGNAAPKTLGDALVLTKDDTLAPKTWGAGIEHEDHIPIPAGASPRLAFRYETNSFVAEWDANGGGPTVTSVDIFLDNAYGSHVWPNVGFYGEDPLNPGWPDLVSPPLGDGGMLDAATTLNVPPAVAGVPDDWANFGVDTTDFQVMRNLTQPNPPWSEDLSDVTRWPTDAPLDNADSDWLECDPLALVCDVTGDPKNLQVQIAGPGLIVKTTSEPVMAMKLQAGTGFDLRPVFDDDYIVSATYDVSAATAQQIGLSVRNQFLDGMFYATYDKTGLIRLVRRNGDASPGPMTETELGNATVAPADQGLFELEVTNTNFNTNLVVYHNGMPVIRATDTAERWYSQALGIFSDTASSGETWSNFAVKRNPDIYVVLTAPAGVDARVPADVGSGSITWNNILTTSDSLTWNLEPASVGCKAPNGFARIHVEDSTSGPENNVFNFEIGIRDLRLSCPTCPTLPTQCAINVGASQQTVSDYQINQPIDVMARIWIDHAEDLPPQDSTPCAAPPGPPQIATWFQFYEEPGILPTGLPEQALARQCARTGPQIDSSASLFGVPDGQNSIGGSAQVAICVRDPVTMACIDEGAWVSFTPVTPGVHCIELCEVYDMDDDCSIPDRPSADSRPSTSCVARFFNVSSGACTPAPNFNNLNPPSLRIAPGDPVNGCPIDQSFATWERRAPSTTDVYNLHEIISRAALQADRAAATPPLYIEPYATTPVTVPRSPQPNEVCFTSGLGTTAGIAFDSVWEAHNCTLVSQNDEP